MLFYVLEKYIYDFVVFVYFLFTFLLLSKVVF